MCGPKIKILAQLKLCFLYQERGRVFILPFIIYGWQMVKHQIFRKTTVSP